MTPLENYKKSCTELAQEFAKKHNIIFKSWLGDIPLMGFFIMYDVPNIHEQNHLYFDIQLIVIDLQENYPSGFIIEWNEYATKKAIQQKDCLGLKEYANEKLGYRA